MNNWMSFYTHFKREFLRFFTVPHTTIYPALVVVFFYLLVFGIALGARIKEVSGIPYLAFILPGLIAQNVINGSYSNPSGSIFVSRMMGNIADILLAPISYTQMVMGYIAAGMLRGLFLGIGAWLVALPFLQVGIEHPLLFTTYILCIAYVFSCMGIIVGLYAKEWQQLNIFINFVVTPLTFLGGVFYSLDMVPPLVATLTKINPIFTMINGTRFAMLGYSDGNVYMGLLYLLILGAILTFICIRLFRIGYRMRK